MEEFKTISIVIGVTASLWLVANLYLMQKIFRHRHFSSKEKWQLLIIIWAFPLFGTWLIFLLFSKIGKLRPMSDGQRLSAYASLLGRSR